MKHEKDAIYIGNRNKKNKPVNKNKNILWNN